jgi:hypothetical protein
LRFIEFIVKEVGAVKRLLRREYYLLFRSDYIKKQLENRKGVCGRHGCCDLTITGKIFNKYLRKCLSSKSRQTCLRWNNLPKECKLYPIDEKDKIPETRNYCNFHWDKDTPDDS